MPTILIVDDEPAIRRLVHRLLTDAGFSTIEASSGTEAISIVIDQEEEIDLVLTDLKMPGIDGFQVGARIAALNAQLPVMYMTGYADLRPQAAKPDDCIPAGMVQKPFTRVMLLAAVQRALKLRSHVPAGQSNQLGTSRPPHV